MESHAHNDRKGKRNGRGNQKEYYAVHTGHVDEPTIFSSWGDTHPRVTNYKKPIWKGFFSLESARSWMKALGVTEPREVLKEGAGETSPLPNSQAFYAVADGRNPGIYHYFNDESGVKPEVFKFSGSCHKVFRTRALAEAFIEDWKDTYADVWRKAIREALDLGYRPEDMEIRIERILNLQRNVESVDELKMGELKIMEESYE